MGWKTLGLKVRYVQMMMLFICLCVNYMMRNNLSIGIVLMTNVNSTGPYKVFNWTVAEQSLTQSVFFAGYFFSNFVAAILVTKFSIKLLLLGNVSITAITTLLLPTLVMAGGYYVLITLRFLLGVTQGSMMASSMGLMSRWVPPLERGRCTSLVLSGIHIGNLVSFSVSGWIGSNYGWPSTFYFTGTAGVLWAVLWAFLGADSTDRCFYISKDEKLFIDSKLAETATRLPTNVPIPWRQILKSKACWAIVIPTLGHAWGYWTLVTEIPTYFNAVQHLPPTLNGIITALPYACMAIVSAPISYISDLLVKKGIFSAGACRKLFNSIGHFGAALCLLVLGFTGEEVTVVTMYVIAITVLTFSYIGHNINHLDILPNFAGFLMGLTNGMANITSFCGPLFVGIIVHDAKNEFEWKIVFFVAAALFAIGNLAFIVMGSGEELEFNKIPDEYFKTIKENQQSSDICKNPPKLLIKSGNVI